MSDDKKLPPIPTRVLTEDTPMRRLIAEAFENSAAHGFHEGEEEMSPLQRLGKYMLMVTEVAEAAEVVREDGPEVEYDHIILGMDERWSKFGVSYPDPSSGQTKLSLGKPVGLLSEEADIVIRVFDEVGRRGQADNFIRVLIEKMQYNRTRPVKHGKNC